MTASVQDAGIVVRAADPGEAGAAAAVLNAALGGGFVSEDDMLCAHGPLLWSRTFVAVRGPQVVGAAVVAAGSAAEVLRSVPPAVRPRVVAVLPGDAWAATLHALAVSPGERGHGVGEALARAGDLWADAQGAAYTFALAWTDRDGCHAAKALERAGYAAVDSVLDVWLADSLERGYECPSDGSPCRCSAVLYVRRLT